MKKGLISFVSDFFQSKRKALLLEINHDEI